MQRLRTWKYWAWARDLGFVALVALGVRAYQQRNLRTGAVPRFAAVDLAGHSVSSDDYRGEPFVLHFWATWCGVCRAEQGNIDAVARELTMLSVASRSGSASEVAAYVREHGIVPRIVLDPDGSLAARFGVSAYPTTFIVDARGEIEHAEVGYTTQLGLCARFWLAEQLGW